MAIKNILVAFDGLPGSLAALTAASEMRKQNDAHLTGLLAHRGSLLSQRMQPWMPKSVQTALMEVEDRTHQEIREQFSKGVEDVHADKTHWIESKGPVQRTVAAYARLYDLIILGMQEGAAEQGDAHVEISPDRLAFDCGRPVMIFPEDHAGEDIGRRVVLAWDGGRAASRALSDAIQIFPAGSFVEIVSVGRSPFARTLPGMDVAAVLKRHEIEVSLTELPRDRRSVADTLVDHCEAVGASLLVMGAYEHSPLREGLIGGVTQDISGRARIPILMSH